MGKRWLANMNALTRNKQFRRVTYASGATETGDYHETVKNGVGHQERLLCGSNFILQFF